MRPLRTQNSELRTSSPFITQTANKVFRSVDEAFAYFEQKGYFQPHSLFGS